MHGHVRSWRLAAAAWLISLGCHNVSAEHMVTGNFGDIDHEDGSMAFFKAASQNGVREALDEGEKSSYDYDSTQLKRTPSDDAHKRTMDGSDDVRQTGIQAHDVDHKPDVLPLENTPLPVTQAGFSASIAQQNQRAKENESNGRQQQQLQQDLEDRQFEQHEQHEQDEQSDQHEQLEQHEQHQNQQQQQKVAQHNEQEDQQLAEEKEQEGHDNFTHDGVQPAKDNVIRDKLRESTNENAKERSMKTTKSLSIKYGVHEQDRGANESLKQLISAGQGKAGLAEEARSAQGISVGVVGGETRGATATRKGPVEQGRPRRVSGRLGEEKADSRNEQRRNALRSQEYGAEDDYSNSHINSAHEMQDTQSSGSSPVYAGSSQVQHESMEHAENAGIDEARLSTDFKEADANANGKLEEREIESLLSRVAAPMDIKWRDFDHDHDGKLTFFELRNLVMQEGDRIVDEDAVKDGFYRADADRTGFLEASEVSALMKNVGAPPSLRWELFDEDHDGRLSFGELLQLARETEIEEEAEHGHGGYSPASFDEDSSQELQDDEGETWEQDAENMREEDSARRMSEEEMMHYMRDGEAQYEPDADAISTGDYGA